MASLFTWRCTKYNGIPSNLAIFLSAKSMKSKRPRSNNLKAKKFDKIILKNNKKGAHRRSKRHVILKLQDR